VIKGRRRAWAPGSASKTSSARLKAARGRTWGRRGHTPVVRVTGASSKRVSLAALIAAKPGCRPPADLPHAHRPRARQQPAQGLHRD
jgi:hypothetical protein